MLGLAACSKDEEPIVQTDSMPSISLTKPTDYLEVTLGETFPIEGLVTDVEGLAAIHYTIESPYASYNYTASNSMEATGNDRDFYKAIALPVNASVGEAKISVYCTDTDNNRSDVISRKIIINDETPYTITILKDTMGASDVMEVQAFKNAHGVVDSLVIINQTRAETLATITDNGGFKSFNFEANQRDLLNNYQSSYTHQFNISSGGNPTLSFYEYDGSFEAMNLFLY